MYNRQVRLRLVKDSDEAFLLDIRNKNRHSFFNPQLISKESHHKWFLSEKKFNSHANFIILCDGNRIGTISLLGDELGRFLIAKNYRGDGIGTSVLKMFKRQARKRGVFKLNLYTKNSNTSAIAFYLRNDFRITGFKRDIVKMSCIL